MQVVYPDVAIDDVFIIAGPLNLNRRMMRADTVMGERLQLSPPQFRTLLMLVSNEGVAIPFEELHMFMTMPDEEKCSIQSAKDVVVSLVNIVNISGRGFAKINTLPNDEYVFVTKWGMDWRTTGETSITEKKMKSDAAAIGGSDKFSKMVLSIAMFAALAVFVGSYFAYRANDNGLIYIPAASIPLSEMPNFGQIITFPYIRGNTFYANSNNSIYVEANNMFQGDVVFMLCLNLADEGTPLSHSILLPRGESTSTVYLPESLGTSRYLAQITLRAFCGRNLTEIESINKQVVIYVE